MRSLVPKLLTIALLALGALIPASVASAAPTVSGIFPLKTEIETNSKITAGPDGNVWFTLQGKKVGMITPAGAVQEFELKGVETPIGIASGPEGRIWVVSTGKAASFLPADPVGTEQDFKSELINVEANIVLGPDGLFWVASNNKVAKFSPANFDGTITNVPLTGELAPKDIDVVGPLVAISDKNEDAVTEKGRVVTFTTAGVQKDFTIPGGSQGLAGSPAGQIAYSAPEAKPEQSGLITPPGPASAFELLGDPFGIAYGADQAFWIVQFAKGQLTRLAPDGQTSVLGGLPVESARQITAGPNGTLWVTLVKKEGLVPVSAIAKVTGVEPPAPPAPSPTPPSSSPPSTPGPPVKPVPDTVLGKHPKKVVKTIAARAIVTFTFSSNVAGSTFQCKLVKPAVGKKKKKKPTATFVGCRSPKVLKLAPGKYRFAVRAVTSEGVVDGSPVESAFKVVRASRHK